tara:strand:- start:1579 stop:1782 length:204 start_codon:yes stop_codon:yes gene_type:complete
MPLNERITEYQDWKDNMSASLLSFRQRIENLEKRLKNAEEVIEQIQEDSNPTYLYNIKKAYFNQEES